MHGVSACDKYPMGARRTKGVVTVASRALRKRGIKTMDEATVGSVAKYVFGGKATPEEIAAFREAVFVPELPK